MVAQCIGSAHTNMISPGETAGRLRSKVGDDLGGNAAFDWWLAFWDIKF
jgi:hypothetical protein